MQRKSLFLLSLSTTLAVLFSACDNFALPTGIAVKTDAEYNVALGQFSYDLSSAAQGQSLDSTLASSLGENASYYNYVTGSDAPLTYLLQYPLYDVPLDIEQYFEEFEFGETVGENAKMDFVIEIPSGEFDAGGAEFSAAQILGASYSGSVNFTVLSENTSEQTFTGNANLNTMSGKGIQKFSFNDAKVVIDIPRPDGWSENITATMESFTIGSGTLADDNVASTGLLHKEYNWSATDLTPESSIESNGKIKFTIPSGVTVNNNNVVVSVKIIISTLSSVTVDLKALNGDKSVGYTLPTNGDEGSVEISNEMLKYLKKIAYITSEDANASFGISAQTINSMPEGNDIAVKLTAFKELSTDKTPTGYFTKTDAIKSGNTVAIDANWTGAGFTVTLPAASEDDSTKHYLDFVMEINDEQTFTNLSMGQNYNISVSNIEIVNNFSSVTANLSEQSQDIDQDMSAFNLNEMLSSATSGLGVDGLDSMKISELEVYFFANKPDMDALKDVSMTGDMHLVYDGNETGLDLLESSNGNLYFVDAVSWPEEKGSTINATDAAAVKTFNQATASGQGAKYYSFKVDLAETLNNKPSGLKMKGTINMGDGSSTSDLTLTKKQIDEASSDGGKATIALEMAIVLPFKFEVSNPIKFTALAASEENADLLGRESASTYAEFTSYLSAIDYVKMSYSINNDLLKDMGLKLYIEDKGGTGFSTTTAVGSGNNTLKLTSSDMEKVFTKYPFNPEISIVIADGATEAKPTTVSIKGGTLSQELNVAVNFGIKMDGDTPITVWGGKVQ